MDTKPQIGQRVIITNPSDSGITISDKEEEKRGVVTKHCEQDPLFRVETDDGNFWFCHPSTVELEEPKREIFFVWRAGDRNPMHQHETLKAAQDEALRLAWKTGHVQRFFICKAVEILDTRLSIEWSTP